MQILERGRVKEKESVRERGGKKRRMYEEKRSRDGIIFKTNGKAYLRVTSLVLLPGTAHQETSAHYH